MSEAAKWYVIHTYSGYENKVAQNIEKVVENRKLHELIQEVRVPTEKATEITDGKTKEVERKTYGARASPLQPKVPTIMTKTAIKWTAPAQP